MTGRELQLELAAHLRVAKERHVVWTEVSLPDGRADIFAIRPSWGKRDIRIYEVKASRSDFWQDVNEGKYRRYLPFCNRLYFAAPAGLIQKREVPGGCGLVTRSEGGWRVVKPPVPREIEEPSFDWMVALLDRCWFEDTAEARRLRERVSMRENGELRPMTWRMGQDAAQKIATWEAAEATLGERNATYQARKLMDAVLRGLREQGVTGRRWSDADDLGEDDVAALAEYSIGLLREAARVEQVGRFLSSLGWRLPRVPELDLPSDGRTE